MFRGGRPGRPQSTLAARTNHGLGVERVAWLGRRPWIKGRTVIAAIEDEAGTIMVKRYRLVLPGER